MEISLQKREAQSWLNLMIPKELQDDQQREGQYLKWLSFVLMPETESPGLF